MKVIEFAPQMLEFLEHELGSGDLGFLDMTGPGAGAEGDDGRDERRQDGDEPEPGAEGDGHADPGDGKVVAELRCGGCQEPTGKQSRRAAEGHAENA